MTPSKVTPFRLPHVSFSQHWGSAPEVDHPDEGGINDVPEAIINNLSECFFTILITKYWNWSMNIHSKLLVKVNFSENICLSITQYHLKLIAQASAIVCLFQPVFWQDASIVILLSFACQRQLHQTWIWTPELHKWWGTWHHSIRSRLSVSDLAASSGSKTYCKIYECIAYCSAFCPRTCSYIN